MSTPPKVFHWDRFGRAVCRGKVIYRRVTKVVRQALELLRQKAPDGYSLRELQEATGHPDIADHLRRNTATDPETWTTIYQTPGTPYGDGGYRMFDRGFGHNQDRGNGFGQLHR